MIQNNKGMKRAAAYLITGMLLVSGLVGCTQKEGIKEELADNSKLEENLTTLKMAWWGNQVRNERTQSVFDKYHELNPSIIINGQFFQWDDYWNKLATQVAGKKLPDLIQMDYAYLNTYVGKNQLLDLKPYIDSGELDVSNIEDNVLRMGESGNGIYGIASGINAPCIFYNKTILDESNIELREDLSLEEFVVLAKEVAKKTGYKATIISNVNGSDLGAWTRANNLRVTEKGYPGNAEDYTPFFAILEKGIKDGWHSSPNKVVESVSVEQSPLVYGSDPSTMTWCIIGTSNMLTAYQSAAQEGIEIGISSIPSDDLKKSNYLKPAMFFSVSADTKNPDESVKVLNFLINSKEANEILLGERGVPASKVIQEEILQKISKVEQKSFSYITDVITPNSSPIGLADPEGSYEVNDILVQLKEKIGYGEIGSKEAAKIFFEKANEIYAKNNEY